MIIPQGGVHAASLEANSRRFPAGWRRRAYILGKQANPKAWIYRAIERQAVRPGARDPGRRRQRDGPGPPRAASRRLPRPDPRHPQRDRRRPARRAPTRPRSVASSATKLGLGPDDLVALFVGHNYWLKGLKPLLLAMRERSTATRPPGRSTCSPAAAANAGPFRAMVRDLGLDEVRPPARVPARHPAVLPRERLLRPADLLRPLLARRLRGPRLRPAGDHHRLQRRRRADHRGPRRLRRPRPRRPRRPRRRPRPDGRRRGPAADVGPRDDGSAASSRSTATSRELVEVFEQVAESKGAVLGRREIELRRLDESDATSTIFRFDESDRARGIGAGPMQGDPPGGRQGDPAPAVHGGPPQAADAARRGRPDADHGGRRSASSRGSASATSRSSPAT